MQKNEESLANICLFKQTRKKLRYMLKVCSKDTKATSKACSSSIIETLEKGVKYVQIYTKDTRTSSLTSI